MRTPFRTLALIALGGLAMSAGCGDDDTNDSDGGTTGTDGGTNTGNDGGTNTGNDGGTNTGNDGGQPEGCPDHPNVEDEDGVCVVTGTIEEDLTLGKANAWLLSGGVFVGADDCDMEADEQEYDGTVLTIEAGTTVYGDTSRDSFLSVSRGAKIMAEGTADEPIVLTSSKEEGERGLGDWGGLVINGRATTNLGGTVTSEGGAGCYGGEMDDDDSGVLKYVRVEFGGKTFTDDDELNGIAFQAVGSGTEVDYIQAHANRDDGIEFFGGTVSIAHAVITGNGDDSLDWTFGWRGAAEYVVIQQYTGVGDRGIEADNNEDNNTATPVSNPTLSHFTILPNPENRGMTLRRGTEATLSDFLIIGAATCLQISNEATVANIESGDLVISDSLWDCDTLVSQDPICMDSTDDPDADPPCPDSGVDTSKDDVTSDMVLDAANNNVAGTYEVEDDSQTAPNFKGAGDAADTGAIPGDDWTATWTAYPAD